MGAVAGGSAALCVVLLIGALVVHRRRSGTGTGAIIVGAGGHEHVDLQGGEPVVYSLAKSGPAYAVPVKDRRSGAVMGLEFGAHHPLHSPRRKGAGRNASPEYLEIGDEDASPVTDGAPAYELASSNVAPAYELARASTTPAYALASRADVGPAYSLARPDDAVAYDLGATTGFYAAATVPSSWGPAVSPLSSLGSPEYSLKNSRDFDEPVLTPLRGYSLARGGPVSPMYATAVDTPAPFRAAGPNYARIANTAARGGRSAVTAGYDVAAHTASPMYAVVADDGVTPVRHVHAFSPTTEASVAYALAASGHTPFVQPRRITKRRSFAPAYEVPEMVHRRATARRDAPELRVDDAAPSPPPRPRRDWGAGEPYARTLSPSGDAYRQFRDSPLDDTLDVLELSWAGAQDPVTDLTLSPVGPDGVLDPGDDLFD